MLGRLRQDVLDVPLLPNHFCQGHVGHGSLAKKGHRQAIWSAIDNLIDYIPSSASPSLLNSIETIYRRVMEMEEKHVRLLCDATYYFVKGFLHGRSHPELESRLLTHPSYCYLQQLLGEHLERYKTALIEIISIAERALEGASEVISDPSRS